MSQPDHLGVVTEERFRLALGNFATGVTIITSTDDGEPVGMSANSFTSVSLDPPLVSFCAALTSTTYPRISASERFCVNVLSEFQEDIARTFAQREVDRFANVPFTRSPLGSPVLEGVVAWIDCSIEQEHQAGDHLIVVGRVRALNVEFHRLPLLYFRGQFAIEQPIDREIDTWTSE
ncbi:MAG TPA: flavin reductase family protein [Acidimicrobiales bacterium]|nr:flavin reductase family protein [Acidimicrobiales bacterium]